MNKKTVDGSSECKVNYIQFSHFASSINNEHLYTELTGKCVIVLQDVVECRCDIPLPFWGSLASSVRLRRVDVSTLLSLLW